MSASSIYAMLLGAVLVLPWAFAGALILLTRRCSHPLALARFDGAWDPAIGLTADAAGCATCGACGTTLSIALRSDVAEHFGYPVHGGPRAFMEPTVIPFPVDRASGVTADRNVVGFPSVTA